MTLYGALKWGFRAFTKSLENEDEESEFYTEGEMQPRNRFQQRLSGKPSSLTREIVNWYSLYSFGRDEKYMCQQGRFKRDKLTSKI